MCLWGWSGHLVRMRTQRSFTSSGTLFATPGPKAHVPAPPVVSAKVSRPKRDWQEYNRRLVARGNVWSFIISDDIVDTWKVRTGRAGRPAFTTAAIIACWQVRVWLRLPLRQTQGFITSLFEAAGIDTSFVPEYSTLNKRAKDVELVVPDLPRGGVILVDGTGVRIGSQGDWHRAKWGNVNGKRRFVRVTATIDAETGTWTAAQVTADEGEGTGEVSQFDALLDDQQHQPAVVIADGASDNATCYESARRHELRLITPPRTNAKPGLDPDRDITLAHVARHGLKEWKQRSGYHTRSNIEAAFGAHKTIFGDMTRTRTLATAKADIISQMNIYNHWLEQERTPR